MDHDDPTFPRALVAVAAVDPLAALDRIEAGRHETQCQLRAEARRAAQQLALLRSALEQQQQQQLGVQVVSNGTSSSSATTAMTAAFPFLLDTAAAAANGVSIEGTPTPTVSHGSMPLPLPALECVAQSLSARTLALRQASARAHIRDALRRLWAELVEPWFATAVVDGFFRPVMERVAAMAARVEGLERRHRCRRRRGGGGGGGAARPLAALARIAFPTATAATLGGVIVANDDPAASEEQEEVAPVAHDDGGGSGADRHHGSYDARLFLAHPRPLGRHLHLLLRVLPEAMAAQRAAALASHGCYYALATKTAPNRPPTATDDGDGNGGISSDDGEEEADAHAHGGDAEALVALFLPVLRRGGDVVAAAAVDVVYGAAEAEEGADSPVAPQMALALAQFLARLQSRARLLASPSTPNINSNSSSYLGGLLHALLLPATPASLSPTGDDDDDDDVGGEGSSRAGGGGVADSAVPLSWPDPTAMLQLVRRFLSETHSVSRSATDSVDTTTTTTASSAEGSSRSRRKKKPMAAHGPTKHSTDDGALLAEQAAVAAAVAELLPPCINKSSNTSDGAIAINTTNTATATATTMGRFLLRDEVLTMLSTGEVTPHSGRATTTTTTTTAGWGAQPAPDPLCALCNHERALRQAAMAATLGRCERLATANRGGEPPLLALPRLQAAAAAAAKGGEAGPNPTAIVTTASSSSSTVAVGATEAGAAFLAWLAGQIAIEAGAGPPTQHRSATITTATIDPSAEPPLPPTSAAAEGQSAAQRALTVALARLPGGWERRLAEMYRGCPLLYEIERRALGVTQ